MTLPEPARQFGDLDVRRARHSFDATPEHGVVEREIVFQRPGLKKAKQRMFRGQARLSKLGAMAGVIIIDSIVRGRFQSGTLSYGAFAGAAGRGYMSEGLGLVLRFAFGELRLHRLEANIQPANRASLALVRRQGFRKEGYSPDMLFIDGAWRDHERWAITVEMTDIPMVGPYPTLPAS